MAPVIKVVITTLAVLVATYLLPGVHVEGVLVALVVAVLLGIVNIFVRPILVVLTLPITILSLGLFLVVINAGLILFIDFLVVGFTVANFWWAVAFSLVVSFVSGFLHRLERVENS